MFQTTTIHVTTGEIELSCFLEKGKHDMTWIEFHTLKDENSNQDLVWDNEDFLFNDFYQFLHRWKNRDCTPKIVQILKMYGTILREIKTLLMN